MPLINSGSGAGSVFCGPDQSLNDGFQFQAGPANTDAAAYTNGTVFTGPVVAPQYSDALAIVPRPFRINKITCSVVLGTAPAPTVVTAALLGSVDGVNYNVTLANFATAQNAMIANIEVDGIRFVKFQVTTLDQGTLLPLISCG
jgi:hypothetical protein